MKSSLRIVPLLFAGLVLCGCVRVDIGGNHTPTVGKQMLDLYQAKEAGAITSEEFKRLQAKIAEQLANGN